MNGIFVSSSFTANGNLIETLNTFHVLLIEVKFLIHFSLKFHWSEMITTHSTRHTTEAFFGNRN